MGGRDSEETNLTTNVSHLRKALGEKKNEHQYILMIPGEGYRFVAAVKAVRAEDVLKVEPVFDPLRSDPRFADLLRRVGLAP